MNSIQVRTTIRRTVLAAILSIIAITLEPYVSQVLGGPPSVQMPGGLRGDEGVSQQLDDTFTSLDGHVSQHFVVQFSRELTASELSAVSAELQLRLDGPVPENAYITSTSADEWKTVRNALIVGTPAAVKIFEFSPLDKLAPDLGNPRDPLGLNIPEHAMIGTSATLYVRFFDDVPFTRQRQILNAEGALQPDGTDVARGPTGIWVVLLPVTNVESLASYDEVRFIEPTMPPAEVDMDQARSEVGAMDIDFDGSGVVVAQWEACQTSILHGDLAKRAVPLGSISHLCRPWWYQNASDPTNALDNDGYDNGEPIGVDLDEDGTVETFIDPAASQVEGNVQWQPLPLHYDRQNGHRYHLKKPAQNTVQTADIRFVTGGPNNTVTPTVVQTDDNNPDVEPLNAEYHPTLVSGIVVSNSVSTTVENVPKYPGMLPAGSTRSYAWRDETYQDEYVDAIAHGARISTNSFGWVNDYHFQQSVDPYQFTTEFYDEVVSGRNHFGLSSNMPKRMLIVASTGNQGGNASFWRTARVVNSAKNVIAVANVSSSDTGIPGENLGVPAENSGRGPTMYGRLTPILSAPGSQLDDHGITSTIPVDSYATASGTSFSTPIVSGAAALLSQVYEGACNKEPAPQDLRALLVHSARDLTNADDLPKIVDGTEYIGPDYIFGYGLVRVDEAAELVRQAIVDDIETGWMEHRVLLNSDDQLVSSPAGKQLRVTLVWDDPPYYTEYPPRADTGFLQNDLDLEVIDPDGNRHLPWVLDGSADYDGEPATRKSQAPLMYVLQKWRDHRNTIEQVVVDDAGDMMNRMWTIRVRGHAIRRGPQVYTLVSEVFDTLPGTACGDFSNGSTRTVTNPLDVPDTPLAWMLFWIGVIILIWLILETIFWLYDSPASQSSKIMILSVLALLYVIFHLLLAQNAVAFGFLKYTVALGFLMLLCMAYVLWRVTRNP